MREISLFLLVLFSVYTKAAGLEVRGFNLSQTEKFPYDAAPPGQEKTAAQKTIDKLYDIGVRHIVLNPIAQMKSQTTSFITPVTPAGAARAQERARYLRLIKYIHEKEMTVGIRPIVLLEADQGDRTLWHGNIKPQDPYAWFSSFRSYVDIYVNIARAGMVEEFTIGAELYSMTVGLEDQWPEQPYGFPREWTLLMREIKSKLLNARLMYDSNYTDATAGSAGIGPSGGELERWRYRLVDLKPDPQKPQTITPANRAAWEQLRQFWDEIDVFGIDMYRSLIGENEQVPADYDQLVDLLESRTLQYATDIDTKLFEIELATGKSKKAMLKEVGFKSCTGCFRDPFLYDDPRREVNIAHQAAAYQAVFGAFVKPSWPWLLGISFWDAGTDPLRQGPRDPGFTPLGKKLTESVIRQGWSGL